MIKKEKNAHLCSDHAPCAIHAAACAHLLLALPLYSAIVPPIHAPCVGHAHAMHIPLVTPSMRCVLPSWIPTVSQKLHACKHHACVGKAHIV